VNIALAINKISEFLRSRMPQLDDDFSHVAFDVLKTMMLLAAVDGNISRDEMTRFWECAREICPAAGEELDSLWKASLCSAGYLSLQAKIDDVDACTAEFMRLIEESLVKKLKRSTASVRRRAIACIESMAKADGDFSKVEKSCVRALLVRLDEVREHQPAAGAVRL